MQKVLHNLMWVILGGVLIVFVIIFAMGNQSWFTTNVIMEERVTEKSVSDEGWQQVFTAQMQRSQVENAGHIVLKKMSGDYHDIIEAVTDRGAELKVVWTNSDSNIVANSKECARVSTNEDYLSCMTEINLNNLPFGIIGDSYVLSEENGELELTTYRTQLYSDPAIYGNGGTSNPMILMPLKDGEKDQTYEIRYFIREGWNDTYRTQFMLSDVQQDGTLTLKKTGGNYQDLIEAVQEKGATMRIAYRNTSSNSVSSAHTCASVSITDNYINCLTVPTVDNLPYGLFDNSFTIKEENGVINLSTYSTHLYSDAVTYGSGGTSFPVILRILEPDEENFGYEIKFFVDQM